MGSGEGGGGCDLGVLTVMVTVLLLLLLCATVCYCVNTAPSINSYIVIPSGGKLKKSINQFQQCSSSSQATVGLLLMLSVPGVGHLQFYCGPGAGH